MIYITGDIHGNPNRFNNRCFYEQKEMSKEDQDKNFMIILGDFGLVWNDKGETPEEKSNLDILNNRSFTTLFIDGNHDCHSRLREYPTGIWHGGKVHFIRPHVIHLMRGQVYEIEGKTFFAFGGASSHDIQDGILDPNDFVDYDDFRRTYREWNHQHKLFRVKGISWWPEELPSEEEMEEGLKNLSLHNNSVDYILTHSPYTSLLKQMDGGSGLYKNDILTDYLQKIKQNVDYNCWFCGHMHVNQRYDWERTICLYEQITRIL